MSVSCPPTLACASCGLCHPAPSVCVHANSQLEGLLGGGTEVSALSLSVLSLSVYLSLARSLSLWAGGRGPCPSSEYSTYSTLVPILCIADTIWSDSAFFTRGSLAPCTARAHASVTLTSKGTARAPAQECAHQTHTHTHS
eukprot:1977687-Rhodomonas_salina.4